jgi:hypothetical protein
MRVLTTLIASILFVPASAFAWVRTPTCYENRPGSVFECLEGETPIPIAWPAVCVGYVMQQDGSADLGGLASARAATARSFGHWNDVDCANFTVGDLGTTASRDIGVTPEGVPNGNVIMFVGSDWAYPGAVQALTTVTYRISNGEIVDADMEYNEQVFNLGIIEGSANPAILDLENVVTHEAGHFVGLDHAVANENFVDDGAGVAGTTMYATAGLGETDKRSLAADDVAGICNIYPQDRTCVCTFGTEISQSCTVPRGPDDGCTSSTAPRPVVAAALFVAFLAFRRRRA